MRILHLAFEDHRRPGSGGGGIRTREINRRLSARHDITVVTSRYPGARTRVEYGVTYRPLGFNLGHLGSMATYHLSLPWFLLRHRADLVVEDFAAPVSSALVPLWTRCPTLAVVQWLAARETSARYHLPFYWLEELGMRLHSRFVAVSHAIADSLRRANPDADVRVVYSGLDVPDWVGKDPEGQAGGRGPDLLYLGRIELEPKGLDLLLSVVERLGDLPDLDVTIAGEGPHRAELESLIACRGLSERIRLVGRVEGMDKWRLLSDARILVVPSRYESFGLVAAEALAVGTPVAGWALPSLVEILGPHTGTLVAPFDVESLAEVVRSLLASTPEPERRRRRRQAAEAARRRFDWDRAAAEQEQAYREAVAATRRRRARRLWPA